MFGVIILYIVFSLLFILKMYIILSDWTRFPQWKNKLVQSGFRSEDLSDSLFKCYASRTVPNEIARNNYMFYEIRHDEFTLEEVFDFGDRGTYNGQDLDQYLDKRGLSQEAKERIRALFRFAYKMGILGEAMKLKNVDGGYICNHPFDDMDGLSRSISDDGTDGSRLHLDVFIKPSVGLLRDYNSRSEELRDKEIMTMVNFTRIFSREGGQRGELKKV